jgi:hypothetical protein
MSRAQRFPGQVIAAIRSDKIPGIRAGTEPHRFIGIWAVVVEGRVFVRSWGIKPRSWYRTLLAEPVGVINVGSRELRIRAVHTRSERLKAAVDRAYLAKYNTPGALKYARDLGRPKSRATTTELVPLGVPSHPRGTRPAAARRQFGRPVGRPAREPRSQSI